MVLLIGQSSRRWNELSRIRNLMVKKKVNQTLSPAF